MKTRKGQIHIPKGNGKKKASSAVKKESRGGATVDRTRSHTSIFRKIAQKSGKILGSPKSFVLACVFVLAWFLSGRYFGYSDTWQLVINTTTTIVTFLMVFLIQNTQNRDTKALHLKLDELIYVHRSARNHLLEAEEEMDDDEIKRESEDFKIKRENSTR